MIDLPGGRTLFALLTRSGEVGSGGSYAFSAFPSNLQHNDFGGTVTELAAKTGVAELPRHAETPNVRHAETDPPTAYPAFVTFKNLNDSKSVVAVDPDHFDVIFGKGMRLKRITVQITKDPVTTGIEKRLKWLVEYGRRGSRLNGSNDAAIKTNDLSDNLSVGAFSTMLR